MKITTPIAVLLSLGAAAAAMQGCVGDAPEGASDAAVDSGPSKSDASTPIEDASKADTATPPTPDANVPDATPAFEPKQVGGLVLWLDPAVGITEVAGKVSAWADTSSSAIVVSQPTAANQPSKATLSSKPVIAFTSTTWLDAASAAVGNKLDFATGDLTIETVVAIDSPTQGFTCYLYKGAVDPAPYDGLQLCANLGGTGKPGLGLDGATFQLTATTGNIADTKLHLLGLRRVGDKLSLRIDGVEVVSRTVTNRSVDTASPLQVGGRPSGVHSFPSKLGDQLVYKGPVSEANLTAIESYLKTKNGI